MESSRATSTFELEEFIRTQQQRVDGELDLALPPEDRRPAVLHTAMRYSVFSGGKRLRPILCLAAGRAIAAVQDGPVTVKDVDHRTLNPAMAVEILHTYTLVHDDLPAMDDDDERRGRPTVHVKFGEANAILVGDALQALAFDLAARTAPPPPYSAAALVRELATAAGSEGVVGGQVEDILHADSRDPGTVAFIHQHKTADLFRAAVRMGAMAAGATSAHLEAMTRYAVKLGLAFQIADDVLDEGETGASGQELTILSVCSADEARARARDLAEQAIFALRELRSPASLPLESLARFAAERSH